MIPEKLLCAAAARSCELHAAELERGFDPAEEREFSPAFEKKIKKLQRRADHPVFYRTLHQAASFLLVLLLSGTLLLAASSDARATVRGWIKEVYDILVVLRFDDDAGSEVTPADYRLGWMPEGYTEYMFDDSMEDVLVLYVNDSDQFLEFGYSHSAAPPTWFINVSDAICTPTKVNEFPADLYLSTDPGTSSALMWTTPDNAAFYISGFHSEEELIRMAESIEKIKK